MKDRERATGYNWHWLVWRLFRMLLMWLFNDKRYQHTTYKIVYVIVHGMAAVPLELDILLGVV